MELKNALLCLVFADLVTNVMSNFLHKVIFVGSGNHEIFSLLKISKSTIHKSQLFKAQKQRPLMKIKHDLQRPKRVEMIKV